jgi:hypothetical protein
MRGFMRVLSLKMPYAFGLAEKKPSKNYMGKA